MAAPTYFQQDFLSPARYHVGGGATEEFTRDELKAIAENTNRLLDDGNNVPIFSHHKPAGSREGGPRRAGEDAKDALGWLRRVGQHPNGTLYHHLEISDPEIVERIADGRIKFTSPEVVKYRSNVERNGEFAEYGNVIRHVALTPKPRNPYQGPFIAMSEDGPVYLQLSMSDREGEMAKTEDSAEGAQWEPDKTANQNADEARIGKQVLNDLEAAGISAPRGVDPVKDPISFLQQLCAALRQKALEETKKESDKEDDDDLSLTETGGIAQYAESEDEMQDNVQFAEVTKERDELKAKLAEVTATNNRAAVRSRIEAAKGVPPFIKEKLIADLATFQFGDDDKVIPSYTVDDILETAAKCAGIQQFDAGKLEEADHPDGEQFFTEDGGDGEEMTAAKADKIVDELGLAGFEEVSPPLGPAVMPQT